MEKSVPGGWRIVFIHDQGGPKNPQFSISYLCVKCVLMDVICHVVLSRIFRRRNQ